MSIQWIAIIACIVFACIALVTGCFSTSDKRAETICLAEDVALDIPRIVAAVEAKDYAALAAIVAELGHDKTVCALKTHATSAGVSSGSPPNTDGGSK